MPQDEEPTLLAAEPQLFVTNGKAACAFHRDRLGFSCVYSQGLVVTWGNGMKQLTAPRRCAIVS